MRLSPQTQKIIRKTAEEVFGSDITISVFGSRVDDEARGGDIDLLVESDREIPEKRRKSLTFVALIQMRLGDQPIDVIVVDPSVPMQSIHEHAIKTGVLL